MSYPDKPARLLAVVEDLAAAATRARSADGVLQAFHHHLGRVLDTNSLYVALWDEESGAYNFPLDVDAGGAIVEPTPLDGSLTDYVRRTGRAIWVDRPEFDLLAQSGKVRPVGKMCEVWIGVPLRARDRVFGVAALQHYTDPFAFSPADLRTFSLLGDVLAPSLHALLDA
ncbi:MAG: GAF domain-containing protein [Deltaproteobacteria bacterium]|nr:MAG: GAF domain-containing protein [Deltaproteobacteria bacterium]